MITYGESWPHFLVSLFSAVKRGRQLREPKAIPGREKVVGVSKAGKQNKWLVQDKLRFLPALPACLQPCQILSPRRDGGCAKPYFSGSLESTDADPPCWPRLHVF